MLSLDGGGVQPQWRLKLPTNIPFHVVAVRQMAAEGQCDSMECDMEARVEQRGVTEFLRAEKKSIAPTDIHRHFTGC